jgi:MFS family permease
LGYFLSYLDQTSVATITTAIAIEFNAGARYVYPKVANYSIEWVGASFLVTKYTAEVVHTNISTTFQLVWGRLSDIFGRKIILMTCLVIFMLGDLLCGFSQSAIQLYIFRAIAGIGGGGINSLCKIIISDIVSLKDRGKVSDMLTVLIWQYAGIMGIAVALGSGAVTAR